MAEHGGALAQNMHLRILRRSKRRSDRPKPAFPTYERAAGVGVQLDAIDDPKIPFVAVLIGDEFIPEDDYRIAGLELIGDPFEIGEGRARGGLYRLRHPWTHGIPRRPRIGEQLHGLERLRRLAGAGHALDLESGIEPQTRGDAGDEVARLGG